MGQRLTDRIVGKLPTPASGNVITYDAADDKGRDWTPGFGVRITSTGHRSFVLNYRNQSGRARRLTIGGFPHWSVVAARAEAKKCKMLVDQGRDPQGEKETKRDAPTVNDLADRFEAEHLPKKRALTQRDYRALLANEIRPALGNMQVAEVQFSDIDRLHRRISARAPYVANRTVALCSRMFNLAIRWQWRADNPCRGIERNQENKRRRYLSGEELARLVFAMAEHPDRQAMDIFRLLLLTGARRNEVQASRWDQFDLAAGLWTKPGATTKQKTEHRVPLSAPAKALIAGLEREGDYLFPGRTGPHRVEIKSAWAGLCRMAGISGLRIHDLRHSFASNLASAGVGLHTIGALIGHTQAQTTHRYAHLFDDPLREAAERAGAIVANAGKAAANVVPMRGNVGS
jgi:integrase